MKRESRMGNSRATASTKAKALGFFAGVVLAATALADEIAPDALVKNVTNDVISIVQQDQAIQSGDTGKAERLVEAKVLPHFDFQRMTSLAVGKDWRQASPDQRRVLTEKFQSLLVRTYSKALSSYKNQTIYFKPLQGAPTDNEVVVRSEIRQAGAKAISLDYSLEKKDGGWKVFDVSIAGISLVTNYRNQFAEQVKSGGIDGLIHSLDNRKPGWHRVLSVWPGRLT